MFLTRHTIRLLLIATLVCPAIGAILVSDTVASILCTECLANPKDPDAWCANCRQVCAEKTTKKWVYSCRDKQYCQPCTPCLFDDEECMQCESEPRCKRVLVKKQVKETHMHLKCELDKPAKPAKATPKAPAKDADLPPAPPAEKMARNGGDTIQTGYRAPAKKKN